MQNDLSLNSNSGFVEFVSRGAAKVTPAEVEQLAEKLPELRERFAKIQAHGFPNIPQQLGFLADVIAEFAGGQCRDLSFAALSEAAFALLYLDREVDLIPDFVPEVGFADDAAVAATVLQRRATEFGRFAVERGKNWTEIDPSRADT